ncbi:hypothetical protein R1flu_022008 [Riccia fluitans]|uniref:Nucleolar complex-associated protein 3 n=1 Tax=Riccia fluitans TaxID=41844 RepID=A0ABD1ZQY8_9MARC
MPGRPGRSSASASGNNMPGDGGKRKRKQRGGGGSKLPPLPPELADEDIEISDEDLEFVQKHQDYAGFIARLDSASISRQVMGLKPDEDVEAYYEKRAKRENDSDRPKPGEPVDDLPVKTLSGELQYRKASSADAVDATSISMEDRRALVRKGVTVHTEDVASKSVPDPTEQDSKEKEKKSKMERRKEMKQARRKEREEKKLADKAEKERRIPSIPEEDMEELEEFVDIEKRRSDMRGLMAEMGTSILADPDNNLGSLRQLQDMCNERDETISQLAMLSSLAIFKDLIPGYRIRPPTEKEMEMVVSKEVRRVRDFESALLRYYQTYVQFLVKSAKSKSKRMTALKCICNLLEAVPHFNFRESLLKTVVPRLMSSDDDICKLCSNAIISIFKNFGKHGGDATVEAVQLIADLVKLRNCQLRPEAVQVFMSLSFDEDLVRESTLASAGQPTSKVKEKKSKREEKKEKRAKKRELAAKLRKEVKSDFKEAEVLPEVQEFRKQQTLTLSAVFETYFRVLKTSLVPRVQRELTEEEEKAGVKPLGPRPLLGASLEGLAKYAHLINVDFMGDLLDVLRALANGGKISEEDEFADGSTTVWERLQCCIIAFKIVKNNMDALNIDLREFYVRFYNLLFHTTFVSEGERSGQIVAEALQAMLWEGRHTDMQRAAAFVKRLSTLALHLDSAEAIAALVTVRHLLVRYKKCRNILENDGGGTIGGGMATYNAEGDDPDLSGALSTILWETSLLANHYNPNIATVASTVCSITDSKSLVLPTLTPTDAIRDYKSVLTKVEETPATIKKRTARRLRKQPLSDFMSSLQEQYNLGNMDKVSDDVVKPVEKFLTGHFKVMKALNS